MLADDATLIDLARRVLHVDARKHKRADRWTFWTVPGFRGCRDDKPRISSSGHNTASLRAALLEVATSDAVRAAAGPAKARDARAAMHARHCEERRQQEEAEQRADEADAEAKALLADVRVALADTTDSDPARGAEKAAPT